MMWLSRNTKVMDSFSLKNGKLTLALYGQVTQCSGSLTFSLVSTTSTNDVPLYKAKELWIAHNRTCPEHSACELLHMHLFPLKTE